MVDVPSINNGSGGPVSTLLRAQSAGAPNLNPNAQQPAQTLVNQLANGAKPGTVQPGAKSSGASKGDVLPRGSIVDILA